MPSLPRFTAPNAGLSPPLAPAMARVESPEGGSTLITRAPMSDSNIAQYGPAITWVASSTTMPSSSFTWDISGSLGILTFTRPEARNALTWEMYEALERACEAADADARIRVLIIRGSGGAFAAGTDIAQFTAFTSGADGVAYERRLDALTERLERVRVPTIAQVDGPAVGGGCLIAVCADLRICSDRARFGVPVARTLGNCLSMANTARLADLIGTGRVRDLLLTGRLVEADEALAIGLATRVVPADQLDETVRQLAAELTTRATSTVEATKELMVRLRAHRTPAGAAEDVIERCYGSADFREGVAAFREGRKPSFS
jgi:enoyl-CoA hydratase/carnithine racemase